MSGLAVQSYHGGLRDAQRSAEIFPYNRDTRDAPARSSMEDGHASQESVEILATALRGDPFSADINLGLGVHYEFLRDPRAIAYYMAFTRIAPRTLLTQQLFQLGLPR